MTILENPKPQRTKQPVDKVLDAGPAAFPCGTKVILRSTSSPSHWWASRKPSIC